MHEMISLELAKQRREELLHEAEMSRQAKALRATRKWGPAGDQLWYGR
jgi:hypothetical protein